MSKSRESEFEDIALGDYPIAGGEGADIVAIAMQAMGGTIQGDGQDPAEASIFNEVGDTDTTDDSSDPAEDINDSGSNEPTEIAAEDHIQVNQDQEGLPNDAPNEVLNNNNADDTGPENNDPVATGVGQQVEQYALAQPNPDDEPNAAAISALNDGEDNARQDPEAGPARHVAHAWPQSGRAMNYFLHANRLCMVFSIVIVFLSDPPYNTGLAKKKFNGLFLGLPESALRALNWDMIGFWAACFVVHASRGEWSRLEHFKKQCLRLICLGYGVAALFLKWIEPEHINLSYAPGVITIAVEITYLGIDVVADAVCFFFDTAVPWLATIGKPVLSFFAGLTIVIIVWALYRGQA